MRWRFVLRSLHPSELTGDIGTAAKPNVEFVREHRKELHPYAKVMFEDRREREGARWVQLSVQQSPVDERVAADRALPAALVGGEEDLDLDGRPLTDPGGRFDVNELTMRAGGDLARRAAHLGAGDAL